MTTYSTDPSLYIFTTLTAGSSHIVTATSRLETILRAHRIPFKAVDVATDQKARMLWGCRAGKDEGGRVRKLPGLVQEGLVLGDLVEIEDWNEYGELKQHVKIHYDEHTIPSIHDKPPEHPTPKRQQQQATAPKPVGSAASGPTASTSKPAPSPAQEPPSSGATAALPLRSVADEAAQKAQELRSKTLREKASGRTPDVPATTTANKAVDLSSDAPPTASAAAVAVTAPAARNPISTTTPSPASAAPSSPGLPSATSSACKAASSASTPTRETAQSPMTTRRRSGTADTGVDASAGNVDAVAANPACRSADSTRRKGDGADE